MKRYRILHQTRYDFSAPVQLQPHELRLRPREGHELRIETSSLNIEPPAVLRWRRDVEDNSVATASFSAEASHLLIESDTTIQQYDQAPLDFLVSDYATQYPFNYRDEERTLLAPYMSTPGQAQLPELGTWLRDIWHPGLNIETYVLLETLNEYLHDALDYQVREEPGVQSVAETLELRRGSCRDFAFLFMEAVRFLGLAARFVTGYVYVSPDPDHIGSTHAWAEVLLPGAGWKGFDPTNRKIVGPEHIAVAVARSPEAVPPVAGSYVGPPNASLSVAVKVNDIP